jgi:Domain of unknown function (DUF1905)
MLLEGGAARMDALDEPYVVTALLWQWKPARPRAGSWYFITIDGQTSAEIRYATLGRTGGFGSVRVNAEVGTTRWRTSLFPHKESGGFILPIKAEVRHRAAIGVDDAVTVTLRV